MSILATKLDWPSVISLIGVVAFFAVSIFS